jgi:AhpD family alkylhydroperoxidase
MGMTIKENLVKPLASAVLLIAALATAALADNSKPPAPTAPAAATLKEIEQMMGFVPAFVRAVPQPLLPSWWQTAKDFEMNPTTALDGKTKQLIGLAVAAQIPCEYCIIYHTESARLEGASEQQIQEAVGMAAVTRESSTLFNGLQIDKAQFRKDLDHLMKNAHQASAKK